MIPSPRHLSSESRYSFGIAALVKLSFNERWNLVAEPGYLELKFRENWESFPTELGNSFVDKDFGYLSLPLSLQYNLWDRISLEVGPQLSYLLSFETSGQYYLDKSNHESLNLSINANLGFQVNPIIHLGLRFNRSLTPHIKFKTEITDENGQFTGLSNYYKDYHQSWQFVMRFWLG